MDLLGDVALVVPIRHQATAHIRFHLVDDPPADGTEIQVDAIDGGALLLSRRTLLGGAALAVAAPVLSSLPAEARRIDLGVDLVNRRSGQQLYAHFLGVDTCTGNGSSLPLMANQGLSGFARRTDDPARAQCGHPAGRRRHSQVTHHSRPWTAAGSFSRWAALKFFVNPGGGLVLPSVANPADANSDLEWAFCEFTLDASGVYANISFVDFVWLAIGLTLDTTTGQQAVGGLVPSGDLRRWPSGLTSQACR